MNNQKFYLRIAGTACFIVLGLLCFGTISLLLASGIAAFCWAGD